MNAPLAEPSIRLTGAALPDVQRSITLVRWLAASWVVLLIVGYSSLRTPTALAARNFVSADRGIFTTVNVATQTGFAQQFADILSDEYGLPAGEELAFRLEVVVEIMDSLINRAFVEDPEGDERFISEARTVAREYLERRFGENG